MPPNNYVIILAVDICIWRGRSGPSAPFAGTSRREDGEDMRARQRLPLDAAGPGRGGTLPLQGGTFAAPPRVALRAAALRRPKGTFL